MTSAGMGVRRGLLALDGVITRIEQTAWDLRGVAERVLRQRPMDVSRALAA